MADVTLILQTIEEGDPHAAELLLPLVYDDLRKLAAAKMAAESPNHTLQPTALVHEAYVRLVDVNQAQHWNSRGHFFAAAAEAMRRILIEQARRKRSRNAGDVGSRVRLSDIADEAEDSSLDVMALDEALSRLEQEHPRKAELVKLRYFAGLTLKQAAEALGVALSTASEDWMFAKSWLRLEMHSAD